MSVQLNFIEYYSFKMSSKFKRNDELFIEKVYSEV